VCRFNAGEMLIRAGSVGSCLYFLSDGEVLVYLQDGKAVGVMECHGVPRRGTPSPLVPYCLHGSVWACIASLLLLADSVLTDLLLHLGVVVRVCCSCARSGSSCGGIAGTLLEVGFACPSDPTWDSFPPTTPEPPPPHHPPHPHPHHPPHRLPPPPSFHHLPTHTPACACMMHWSLPPCVLLCGPAEFGLISDVPRTATCEAVVIVTALRVERRVVEALLAAHPASSLLPVLDRLVDWTRHRERDGPDGQTEVNGAPVGQEELEGSGDGSTDADGET
jgi:hypothetical protein